jgi:hypothetical protein
MPPLAAIDPIRKPPPANRWRGLVHPSMYPLLSTAAPGLDGGRVVVWLAWWCRGSSIGSRPGSSRISGKGDVPVQRDDLGRGNPWLCHYGLCCSELWYHHHFHCRGIPVTDRDSPDRLLRKTSGPSHDLLRSAFLIAKVSFGPVARQDCFELLPLSRHVQTDVRAPFRVRSRSRRT